MPKPPSAPPRAPSIDDLMRNGLQLHQSGRAEDAAALYRRVLQQDARHPAANHLLGLVFLAKGEAGRAVDSISRAVSVRPDEVQYLGNLGVALNAASRHQEAVDALLRSVSINPGFTEAYSNLGMAYRALGKLEEAASSYRRAIEQKPNEAGFHSNLANTLRDLGKVLAAEQSYRRALELQPAHPGAANGLGGMLNDRWACAEGLTIVDTALASSPRNPQLHIRRGRLLQNLGQLEQAVAEFDRAIELKPDMGEPYHHRAHLLQREGDRHDTAAMKRLFTNVNAALDDRVFAGFALGRALAGLGEHEESVETYVSVNRLYRHSVDFSIERATRELETSFDSGLIEHRSQESEESRATPVIFVVGLPRAGKSTIEAILARHPDTVPMGELPIFGRLFGRFSRIVAGLPEAEKPARLRQLGDDYLAEARLLAGSGKTIIDTLPSNYRLIEAISAALPSARIVWSERDPTEHCIGMFEKFLVGRGHEHAFDLDELVTYHAAYRRLMDRWRAKSLHRLRFVDVARLRRDRATETRELLAHCGLSWADACLDEVQSEPLLTDWTPERLAANRADHMAAWRAARSDLLPIRA